VFGVRDVPRRPPSGADTVFRIASMTKSFTAMAILKLRDEGKLSLDDPAERYVPELKGLRYPTADSPRITIRDLLSHAAGFPEDNAWADRHLHESHDWLAEMMRQGIPFSNAPGVAYEYSNFGFGILGRIVTAASGVPYNDYIQANYPEAARHALHDARADRRRRRRLALGYRWEDERWKDEELLPDGAFGAMGGMLTTIPDLARYVGALLAAFPPATAPDTADRRVRRSARCSRSRARARRSLRSGASGAVELNAGGYGFGLRVTQSCDFGHVVAHGGGLPGFGTLMQWLPEHGVGIIAFANRTYTGWGGVVTDTAFKRLAATGAPAARSAAPAPALVEARDVVSGLVAEWDDAAIDRIAADNLFLDQDARAAAPTSTPCARRSDAASRRPASTSSRTRCAASGRSRASAAARLSVTLAPTMPPKAQVINLRAVSSTEPAVRSYRSSRKTCSPRAASLQGGAAP
jgi:CubicO group peptidase (beta-lactamase class C family)